MTNTATSLLSGLDAIDARHRVAHSIAELLADLERQLDRDRADAIDRPCRDHPGATTALTRAQTHHQRLRELTDRLHNPDTSKPDASELGGLAALGEALAGVVAELGAALDTLDRHLAYGCAHTCPELPRHYGDTTDAADRLLDDLEAHGLELTRTTTGWLA